MRFGEDCYLFCCNWCKEQTAQDQGTTDMPSGEDQHEMASNGDDSGSDDPPPLLVDESGAGGAGGFDGSGDGGLPGHMGSVKQLHNGNRYNLAISPSGQVYGTRDPYHPDAVLEFSSVKGGEVRIRGKAAQMYVAMNERAKVYAEENFHSGNTIWLERHDESGFNNYVWKEAFPEKEWFLGIKKSGKPKRGDKTRPGQKAVRFLPRPAYPTND